MIYSFRCLETEKLFNRQGTKRLKAIENIALRKLQMIHAAETLEDLRNPPGNRLEKLKGDRVDQYSIRINDKWRVCFKWIHLNAYYVEIVDYH